MALLFHSDSFNYIFNLFLSKGWFQAGYALHSATEDAPLFLIYVSYHRTSTQWHEHKMLLLCALVLGVNMTKTTEVSVGCEKFFEWESTLQWPQTILKMTSFKLYRIGGSIKQHMSHQWRGYKLSDLKSTSTKCHFRRPHVVCKSQIVRSSFIWNVPHETTYVAVVRHFRCKYRIPLTSRY